MKIIISALFLSSLFGLSNAQILMLNQIYNYAKKLKSKHNNMSFEKTLCAIYIRESSLGVNLIGDRFDNTHKIKTLYESSLGPGQIKIETVLFILKHFPELQRKWKIKYHSYQLTVKYVNIMNAIKVESNNDVKEFITTALYHKYHTIIATDDKIINLLLNNLEFSLDISSRYLIYNYDYAITHHKSKPFYRAISRYNGGWHNRKYYNDVMKNYKFVRKLIRRRVIKTSASH